MKTIEEELELKVPDSPTNYESFLPRQREIPENYRKDSQETQINFFKPDEWRTSYSTEPPLRREITETVVRDDNPYMAEISRQ